MFTDAEKLEIESLLSEAFDSFKEQVTIYKTPEVTFVSTNPNFNFAFGADQPAANVEYMPVSGTFYATVEYIDSETAQRFTFDPNSPVITPKGEVRLGVSGVAARDMLRGSDRIILDGDAFKIKGDILARGIFERDYFDCWLERIK